VRPRRVRAISIGPATSEALRGGVSGEVHSIFERAFNILIGGELVGVARSGVSRSPINLVTDIPTSESMPSLGVRKGMQVQKVGGLLLIGDVLEISLEGAELWQPKTRAERCLGPELIKRNLELAKRLAANKSGREGLGQLLPNVEEIVSGIVPHVSYSNQVIEVALPHLVNLVKSVRAGDVRGVEESAQKLVGLGPGLSPSADDALSGFTASLWWVSHSLNRGINSVKGINETIVSCSGTTTLLSQQLLRHAAKGETNERVGGLLEAILAGTTSDVEKGVEEVLQIGETSGIDIMVGLLLGVQLGLEMRG